MSCEVISCIFCAYFAISFQCLLRLNFCQARSQVLTFGRGEKYVFRGKDFCFYYMFKIKFSGHNKICRVQKNLRGTATECPLIATGLVFAESIGR